MENTLDTALKKLRLNALLMQTFMAEEMNRHGFGYQTFQLEENDNNEVLVHVFTSELTTEKAHQMNGDELYAWFHKGIENYGVYCIFEKVVQLEFHVLNNVRRAKELTYSSISTSSSIVMHCGLSRIKNTIYKSLSTIVGGIPAFFSGFSLGSVFFPLGPFFAVKIEFR